MQAMFCALFNTNASSSVQAGPTLGHVQKVMENLYPAERTSTYVTKQGVLASTSPPATSPELEVFGIALGHERSHDGEAAISAESQLHRILREVRLHNIIRAPEDFSGEFALVITDKEARLTNCCADHLGIFHIYYAEVANMLLVSPSPLCISALLEKDMPFDRRFIAQCLRSNSRRVLETATAFDGVRKLLPGHRLIIKQHTWCIERYWFPEKYKLPSTNRSDVRKAVLDTLTSAVHARMPEQGNILCDISGGIDSTAVLSIASKRIQDIGGSLYGRSILHKTTKHFSEDSFINLALRASVAVHLPEYSEDMPGFDSLASIGLQFLPEPTQSILSIPETIAFTERWKHEFAISAYLSGHGADHVFGNSNLRYLRELLLKGQFYRFFSDCGDWAESGSISYWKLLRDEVFRASVVPLNPPHYNLSTLFTNLCQELQSEALDEHPWRFKSTTGTEQFVHILAGARVVAGIMQTGALCGLKRRFPYMDRPLVELICALPSEERVRPPLTKQLLRESVASIVPESICTKWAQPVGDVTIIRKMKRSSPTFWHALFPTRLGSMGLIREEGFRNLVQEALQGHAGAIHHLTKCFVVELWLSAVTRHLPAHPTHNDLLN